MESKKENSWFVRLPFVGSTGFFDNDYVLTEDDINKLKEKATAEGRTLGKFIAYHLKQLVK